MNTTMWFEKGEQVFPCWCGETHKGAYAEEDWNHHNCLHRDSLVLIHGDMPDYWICMPCGQTFNTETQ